MKLITEHKCPRCDGTLVIDLEDVFCLSCSYRIDLPVLDTPSEAVLV